MTCPRLTPFEARWLAEWLRLVEQSKGRLPDAEAMQRARVLPAGAEARLIERASILAANSGHADVLHAWLGRMHLLAGMALLFAFASGVGAALAAVGDGSRPVNVVWSLGALLGVHLVMLLLWCAGWMLPGGGSFGFGAVWRWLSRHIGGDGAGVAAAFTGLQLRAGLGRWWFGFVTHGVWCAALAGVVLGLFVTFSLRSHGFTWETTLLSSSFFVGFVHALGWLPGLVGFPVPEATQVMASGGAPVADEGVRQTWAWWLLGCVLVYGLLPRLLLLGLCAWRLQRGRARVRLDVSLPGFAELVAELAPASERIGVTDAAPERIEVGRVEPLQGFADQAGMVAIELRADHAWPPQGLEFARDLGVVDGRDQRARVLRALDAAPLRRLLVACDPRLSPDRGSLGLIADLSHRAGGTGVWLIDAGGVDAERRMRWREALAGIGVGEAEIFEQAAPARAWLQPGADDD